MKVNYFDLGLYAGNELEYFIKKVFPKIGIKDYTVHGFEACEMFYVSCVRKFSKYKNVNLYHGAINDSEKTVKLYYASNQVGHSIYESKNKTISPESLINVEKTIKNSISEDGELPYPLYTIIPGPHVEYIDEAEYFTYFYPILMQAAMLAGPDSDRIEKLQKLLWSSLPSVQKEKSTEKGFAEKHIKTHEYVKGVLLSKWIKKNISDFENSFNIMKVNIEGAEWHLFNDLVENDMIKHFDVICGDGSDIKKVPELKEKSSDYYKLLKENNITIHRFSDWKSEENVDIADIILRKMKSA